MTYLLPSEQKIVNLEKTLLETRTHFWLSNDVFTWRWWLLVFLLIAPWFLWYKLVAKRRLVEIVLYGLIISLMATTIDEIGSEFTSWYYPHKIVPFFPRLIPINYTLVPIIYMLIYQYFRTWKSFIIVNIILSFTFALILEPILVSIGLYKLLKWKYYYSIPIYFFAAIFTKWVVKMVFDIQDDSILKKV